MLNILFRKKTARIKRCILHIGTEKTGTSTIQRFLADNRRAHAAEGFLYPKCGGGEDGGSQWGFPTVASRAAYKLDLGRFLNIRSAEDQTAYETQLRRSLTAQIESAHKAHTLVISSEHMHSRLRHLDEIKALKTFLHEWVDDFQIVLYLRRQDRVAASLYSTMVKSGNPAPKLFIPFKTGGKLPYYFDYESIYAQWAETFGANNVNVRLFGKDEFVSGSLLEDFSSITDISLHGKRLPKPENESISQEGLNFLISVNKQLPQSASGEQNPLCRKITSLVSNCYKGHLENATREEALAFYTPFQDGNERLRQRLFTHREQPLFDDDFSSYPEQTNKIESTFDDAVRIAIRLLQADQG